MLDINYIRENAEAVEKNCEVRGMPVDIKRLLELDEQRRAFTQKEDALRTERNENTEKLKATEDKQSEEAQALITRGKAIKDELAGLEDEASTVIEEYNALMMAVPNLTAPGTPVGKDDHDNVEISRFGEPTEFDFEFKDHVQLGKDLDILDFERGADVAGRGFYYLKNGWAQLEMGLTQFAMQKAIANGYMPMITPDVARQEVLQGTGFNPRGESTQIYNIEGTDLSLVATAEIPAAGYYRNHVFKKGELDEPIKIVAYSHCFRTEAGAYGRESHGIYRVHQFAKVEMFIFCKPEDSEQLHEELRELEEEITQAVEVPYRVVDICTGDLGGPAYKKYDLEAWMPFRNDWGEITSASNVTDYQARRLNIKYENDEGKREYVHMLNGTAAAMSRLPLAIVENHQQADGTINVPEALRPFMGGISVIG